MRSLALRLYVLGLAFLPNWLRDEAAAEMRAAFVQGQREAGRFGHRALMGFWAREFAGLCLTAYRSRHPDSWTRRTSGVSAARRSQPTKDISLGLTMDHLLADLHYAFRTLVRRPAVTLLVVLTLSLGIGASTAMFSVVQSVLLRALPYPQPERLVSVYPGWPDMRGHPTLGDMAERGTWSWPEFFGVVEHQTVFRRIAAYEGRDATRTGDGPAQRVSGVRTTWQLFPMLGVAPHLGRLFNEDDERESRVVVLSHGNWKDRFGSDPDAIGRSITLNDEAYEVVGVLPPGFRVADTGAAEFWFPMTGSFTMAGVGNHGATRAVARLADGVSVQQAKSEITQIFGSILDADHGEHEAFVFLRQADETRRERPVLLVMLAASVLLLLVACGNAAAFLLGTGLDREREIAVRGALGATRRRMTLQLLVESALLGGVSVVGGVVAAVGLSKLMLLIAPDAVPGLERASIDGVVLGFSVLTSLIFGVGFGLIPALSLSNVDLASAMGSGRSTSSRRAGLQSAVVVGELALACILVVSGVLLMRTVGALGDVDTGFETEHLAVVIVATPVQRFRDEDGETDSEALEAYQRRMVEEIEAIPGVLSVSTTSVPPFTSWRGNNNVEPENWDPTRPSPIAERRFVSPDFFETIGIEIVQGRGFTPEDGVTDAPPVVVISEGLADLGWPDSSPVGRPLRFWGRDATVVGVAGNVRDERVEDVTELAFYAPGYGGSFLIRTAGDPANLVPVVRDRVWSVDADAPILVASTVTDLVAASIAEEVYRARLMGVFAALAGLLAMLGIYGVTSRAVSRRTREIGIRVALGANRGRVWHMVFQQAFRLGVFGAVVGIAGSLVVSRFLESFLWGVSSGDPVTLVSVFVGLPLLTALAAVLPAWRATRVDPLEALRAE